MSSPKAPPPGSVPGMSPSPDMDAMMQQMMGHKNSTPGQSGAGQTTQSQQPPREVGTVPQEVARMGTDLFEAFKEILGLRRPPKTQEEIMQLQQFHQNWQRLDMEQQQVAQMRIQQELQRKEMMQQEEEMKKAQAEQEKQQNEVVIPHGKVSGQAALDKMQQDRKGMGGASG